MSDGVEIVLFTGGMHPDIIFETDIDPAHPEMVMLKVKGKGDLVTPPDQEKLVTGVLEVQIGDHEERYRFEAILPPDSNVLEDVTIVEELDET